MTAATAAEQPLLCDLPEYATTTPAAKTILAPEPAKTLDKEFDRILKMRAEDFRVEIIPGISTEPAKVPQPQFKDTDVAEVAAYERRHPEYFPAGTTLEKKIDTLKKIGKVQADEKMIRQASIKALDKAAEKKAIETETTKNEDALKQAADAILNGGDIMEYFLKEYRNLHTGQEIACRVVVLTSVCQNVIHSTGIHPKPSGVRGCGKSSAITAGLRLLPSAYVHTETFSPKALFYDETLLPGTIIFSDDMSPNEDVIGFLKASISRFHEGNSYKTVAKQETKILKIPPETVFILTSVQESSDDQFLDRQYVIPLEKNDETNKNFIKFLAERAKTGEYTVQDTNGVQVCRAIMEAIKSKRYRIIVPFADEIIFCEAAMPEYRAINMFYDFMSANAALYHRQREYEEKDGLISVTATKDDFDIALSFFPPRQSEWGMKLSKKEKQLFDLINAAGKFGINESDLCDKTHSSKGSVHDLLHGRPDRHASGLVDKAPVTFDREHNKDTGRSGNFWRVTGTMQDGLEPFARL